MIKSEAYLDIVWRQFKKNRFALISLAILGPLFWMAIFAPLIASDQPLVYQEEGETIYPWFRAIFNPAEPVDFVFNMAMLGFVPWVVILLLANSYWKRGEVPGRQRIMRVAGLYVAIIILLCAVFSFDALRPKNKYRARTFTEEQFQSDGGVHALYPPIPFGPTEQDFGSFFKPPMYRKAPDNWKKVNDGFLHVLGTDNTGRESRRSPRSTHCRRASPEENRRRA